MIQDLFADIPTVPDCSDLLNIKQIKQKYKNTGGIAVGMLAAAKKWQRCYPDKDMMEIIPTEWKEYIRANIK